MSARLPDAQARAEALDLDRHVLATAPAGSGKTGLLVTRYLRALATVNEPEQVVAITFTNKAAAEIRHRALNLLLQAGRGAPVDGDDPAPREAAQAALARDALRGWQLLNQPERLRATTIDAFCGQLAAQMPLLSGLGGRLAVTDDAWPLYTDSVMRLLGDLEDRALDDADRDALETVLRLADNRIDRLLDPLNGLLAGREQWIRHAANPDRWGAGEDHLLQALVQEALGDFTASLAPEVRTELADLLRLGSGHAEALAWASDLQAWPSPEPSQLGHHRRIADVLLTQDAKLRSPRGINVKQGFGPKDPHTPRIRAWLTAQADNETLVRAARRVRSLPDPQYPESLRGLRTALLRVMRRLAAELKVLFGERGEADFAQLAESALGALKQGGHYGEALLAADRQIRHLLVDEMQDTSERQIELLDVLTEGWEPGDGRSLFLVGDPQQSIYAFRKAEVRLFLDLQAKRQLGRLPLHCVSLSSNFRSDPAVVNWFNAAFTRIFPAAGAPGQGVVRFTPSHPQRASAGGGVSVQAYPEDDEAQAAEQAAADAADLAGRGESVAILGRSRSHIAPVIRALRARGITPACQDIDPLATEPAVRDYIALARALWQPEDRLHWAVLLRAPFVGLSWADLVALSRGQVRASWPERLAVRAADPDLSPEGRARIARLLQALSDTAEPASLRADLAARTEALWHGLGGPACIEAGELADVQAAMLLLREQARDGGLADEEALDRGLSRLFARARPGQIQVMTVHKAKGLEFDHVLLVGAGRRPRGADQPLWHLRAAGGDDLLVPRPPAALAEDDPAHRLYDYLHAEHVAAAGNEALRLLYVAVTRARRSLRLYVGAGVDRKTGAPRFAAGSFAALLAPVIGDQVDPARLHTARQTLATDDTPPRAARLPLDVQYRAEPGLYRPSEARTLRPSESVLHALEAPQAARDAGDELEAQLIGTRFHEALERIAEQGLEPWTAGAATRMAALLAGLRRQGLPAPRVAAAASRVLDLVARTLDSPEGRWLLAPKPWARNEYHLAGYRDGRWVAAVIDRCFEEPDGTLWIIDYKAAARPLLPEAVEAYLASVAERYREQLQTYAALLGELRPGRRLRTALYLPDPGRLLELDTGARP